MRKESLSFPDIPCFSSEVQEGRQVGQDLRGKSAGRTLEEQENVVKNEEEIVFLKYADRVDTEVGVDTEAGSDLTLALTLKLLIRLMLVVILKLVSILMLLLI